MTTTLAETVQRTFNPPTENWYLWPIVGRRGGGKTYSALDALPGLLHQHETAIVVAPSLDHARWCAETMVRQRRDEVVALNRTHLKIELTEGRGVVFVSQHDFHGDDSRFYGMRFKIAVLDAIECYPDDADGIAGYLRLRCRTEQIITTSAFDD